MSIRYSAFTLIEMLIVMTIFTAILGIGISAFSGLRATILLNQRVEDIKQNVRWVQRSAVLLKREPGENWIYGIGLDMSVIGTREQYAIFKWCAPGKEYHSTPGAQSRFPAHPLPSNGIYNLGSAGNLPLDSLGKVEYQASSYCDNESLPDAGVLALLPTSGSGVVSGTGAAGEWVIDRPLRVGYNQGTANVRYILFEAVTGNVFLYDGGGNILNYTANGTPEARAIQTNYQFVISTPSGDRGQHITISHESGKVTTKPISAVAIANFHFSPELGEPHPISTDPLPWEP